MSVGEMNSSVLLSDSVNVDKDGRRSGRISQQPSARQCDSLEQLSPLSPCERGSPSVDVKLQGQLRLERELNKVKKARLVVFCV
jgi:hypothetical protein